MMNGLYRNLNNFTTSDDLDQYAKFIAAKTRRFEEWDSDEDELTFLIDWEKHRFQNIELPEEIRTLSERDVSGVVIVTANSPFESIDENRIQETDAEARKIISHLHVLDLDFGERLSARLKFLLECSKEEDPEQIAISPDSLKDFVAFWGPLATEELKYPDIVLSPIKNIRVLWQNGMNKRTVIEFLGDKRVQFVIFRPDPNDAQNPIRLSGFSSVESIMREILVPNKVNWILR
jgi:hypothetical protein